MHRRPALAALAALFSSPLWAATGSQTRDKTPPLYLQGSVASLLWGEPQARLELAPDPGARVPADLRERLVPHPATDLEAAARLVQAAVPVSNSRIWRVELPSLAQLSLLDVPRPEIKQSIGVIGHLVEPVRETPTLRAEILLIGERAYVLRPPRSEHAPRAPTPPVLSR